MSQALVLLLANIVKRGRKRVSGVGPCLQIMSKGVESRFLLVNTVKSCFRHRFLLAKTVKSDRKRVPGVGSCLQILLKGVESVSQVDSCSQILSKGVESVSLLARKYCQKGSKACIRRRFLLVNTSKRVQSVSQASFLLANTVKRGQKRVSVLAREL